MTTKLVCFKNIWNTWHQFGNHKVDPTVKVDGSDIQFSSMGLDTTFQLQCDTKCATCKINNTGVIAAERAHFTPLNFLFMYQKLCKIPDCIISEIW